MRSLYTSVLLAAAQLSSFHHNHVSAVMVGDEVCITGYIMDNFCIFDNGGVLLDDSSVTTLQNPERHSYHCLLDVPVCYNSGFQVLGEKDPVTDRHCLGFRLDDTEAVLAAGRALGKKGFCSNCKGTDDADPEYGYRATVKGTVKELGDGTTGVVTSAPMLTNIEVLDESVECDGEPTIPPLCGKSVEPSSEPASEPSSLSAAFVVSTSINAAVFITMVSVTMAVAGLL
mmetsp:Transcript_27007/g.46062  ORF Transcript_27007/g.46062 Transcript_27007/m.46062 type:complete len:229 (-) Transcript_27007:190-876(-)